MTKNYLTKILLFINLLFLFVPSLFAGELELVWEKYYSDSLGKASPRFFNFEQNDNGKILLVNHETDYSYLPGEPGEFTYKNSVLNVLRIDTSTGQVNYLMNFKKGFYEIYLTHLNNDTLTVYGNYGKWNPACYFILNIMKFHLASNGNIDTIMDYPPFFTIVEARDVGINMYFKENLGLCSWIIRKDSLEIKRINTTGNKFNVESINISKILYGTNFDNSDYKYEDYTSKRLDDDNFIMIGGISKINGENDVPQYFIGHFNAKGDIVSRKTFPMFNQSTDSSIKETHIARFYQPNNHLFVLGSYSKRINETDYELDSYFMRELTEEGEILNENIFDKSANSILNGNLKNFDSEYSNFRLYLTNNNEFYVYGYKLYGNQSQYSNYSLAKFSSKMQLVYNKEWSYENKKNIKCGIHRILCRNGYIYITGKTNLLSSNPENDTLLYIAKFKEPTTSITEPLSLVSSTVYPNPTAAENIATVRLELEDACDLRIVLSDILGQEIMQVHEGFAEAGTFTKSFTTQHLSKGVYFLKTLIGGQYKIEKIVVND